MKIIVNMNQKEVPIDGGWIELELDGEPRFLAQGDRIVFGSKGILEVDYPRWRLLFTRKIEIDIE